MASDAGYWYQFNVNAGDNLVLTTTTPGGSSANGLQFINDLAPTINLYDASGNLVATATGNAADGRNDVIDWTALTSGSYRVQILGANKTNLGEYTISIQGATGGLTPFTVTSTNPAAGSRSRLPGLDHDGQRSATASCCRRVSPSDFTIDGNDATGVDRDRQPHRELHASRRPPTASTTSRSAAWSTSRASRSRPTTSRSRPTRCRRSSSRARSPTATCFSPAPQT